MITITQSLMITDDLTGGNSAGVLLAKMGFKTHSILSYEHSREDSDFMNCDCLIITTDSRTLTPKEAYSRIKHATKVFRNDGIKLYSKRIDSTLRGNIGAETDAMLDSLGEEYIAVCAPCLPSSGRILAGGYVLVNGIPLHKTNFALDPITPSRDSDIAKVIQSQSRYKTASLHIEDLMNGKHELAEKINTLSFQGHRIIIIDCITHEDLNLIADAVITSKQKVLAVDPGAFTASLARKIITSENKSCSKILAVIGSINPNTRTQMEKLWLSQRPIANVFIETKRLIENEVSREQEIMRAVGAILELSEKNTILTLTTDGIYPENIISGITEYLRGRINTSLSEAALRILRGNESFRGIYACGGEITQSLCDRLGASGLDLRDEVLPFSAYGLLCGGEFDGLHVVTKSGIQGDSNAANQCVNYLKSKLFI